MMLSPALRRFTFAAHVTSSVGWLGAVMVFIALAGVGLISRDEVTVRGAYLVMAPAAWFVLVPLAHASFVSGVTLSLGTAWGLFRHYWVVFKLLITVFSTVILLVYMGHRRTSADRRSGDETGRSTAQARPTRRRGKGIGRGRTRCARPQVDATNRGWPRRSAHCIHVRAGLKLGVDKSPTFTLDAVDEQFRGLIAPSPGGFVTQSP